MRLLGVDFGGTRIGIAVVDSATKLPRALAPLASSGTLAKDAAAIRAVAAEQGADQIIVGLPLSQGEETRMSKVCRQLAVRIAELGSLVDLEDESLTSHEAETSLREAGLKGSVVKRKLDGEAACRILERYLETHGPETS